MNFFATYSFTINIRFQAALITTLIAVSCANLLTNDQTLRENAKNVESKLNRSAAICDDFYEFACGNFRPEIPSDKAAIGEHNIVEDMMKEQLNNILSSTKAGNEANYIKILKKYYSSCMHTGDK